MRTSFQPLIAGKAFLRMDHTASRRDGHAPLLIRKQLPGFLTKVAGWLPVVLLPALACSVRSTLPAWAFMWLLAFAIFMSCKWLTLRQCRTVAVPPWRKWSYTLAW